MLYGKKFVSLNDLILNAKFVDGGRGEKYKFDCWGLCREIFRRCDMILPDYSIVVDDLSNPKVISAENKEEISKAIQDYKLTTFIKLKNPCVPCIVVLKYCLGKYYNHVGTYIGYGQFIHIASDRGCAIEKLDSPLWKQKVEGFYFPKEYWSDDLCLQS